VPRETRDEIKSQDVKDSRSTQEEKRKKKKTGGGGGVGWGSEGENRGPKTG
jgi:hypothetical protein